MYLDLWARQISPGGRNQSGLLPYCEPHYHVMVLVCKKPQFKFLVTVEPFIRDPDGKDISVPTLKSGLT